jgi:hypothetical protein
MAEIDINQLIAQAQASAGPQQADTVLRRVGDPKDITYWSPSADKYVRPGTVVGGGRPDKRAVLDDYNAEFWNRWEDPNYQTWLLSRLVATGRAKAGVTGPQEAYAGWVQIGEEAAKAPGWKGTPEQLLEFYATGKVIDQTAIDKAMENGDLATMPDGSIADPNGVAAAPNPIQTSRSVSTATINPLAANAAIDQLAQSLLGRMASDKELARYRKTMNKIMSSNPTVNTRTVDSTDPDNVQITEHTKDGASAADAQSALQFKLQRGSEGMAFNVGKNFEQALRMMGN